MSVLCQNGTHVYRVGSLRCTCGAAASGYQPGAMMYPFPNNYAPPRPPTPPTAGEAPPLHVFEAAQRAGASHLSADGQRIYCQRLGAVLQAEWDGNGWGSWWSCDDLPPDAVAM